MAKYTILNSPAVPNMPWQERPADLGDIPVWRYTENPIIGRNPVKHVARIFNSAVVPYEDGFIGVFRAERKDGIPFIYLGRSKDGIHWSFEEDRINFVDENGKSFMPLYAYDPRLVRIDDKYYIISSGARMRTALRSAWLSRPISRHLRDLRIRSFRSTGTRSCSRGRSMAITCCSRDRQTAATRRSVISM